MNGTLANDQHNHKLRHQIQAPPKQFTRKGDISVTVCASWSVGVCDACSMRLYIYVRVKRGSVFET